MFEVLYVCQIMMPVLINFIFYLELLLLVVFFFFYCIYISIFIINVNCIFYLSTAITLFDMWFNIVLSFNIAL